VQNVWLPENSNIASSQIAGGLNVIQSKQKPEAINLTSTPAEVFKFLEMLERAMETISSVNSVARGDPQASLKSGAALALVQSMALQFTSGLQQSYVQLMEDVGTALIKLLQDYASSPRFVAIVGKNNRSELKQFTGEDISNINRVIVDVGNPLSRTASGRVQMAENLLQYMPDKINPMQYLNVINTGQLEPLTEEIQDDLNLIRGENEKLMGGEMVYALFTDSHDQHIRGHKNVLSDPELRKDPELVKRVGAHMQEHFGLLETTEPQKLILMGQQPIQPPPPQGPPTGQEMQGAEQAAEMMQPPPQGFEGLQEQNAEIAGPGLENPVNLPNIPQPPAELLPNPELQPPVQ